MSLTDRTVTADSTKAFVDYTSERIVFYQNAGAQEANAIVSNSALSTNQLLHCVMILSRIGHPTWKNRKQKRDWTLSRLTVVFYYNLSSLGYFLFSLDSSSVKWNVCQKTVRFCLSFDISK